MSDQARNLTCELIGTFALTFIGAGAIVTTKWTGGEPGLVGIALAHGVILAIVVSATMNISGGHINPAVTIALWATGRIKLAGAVAYIIAQCAGATLAGVLLSMAFHSINVGPAGMTGSAAANASMLGTPNFGPSLSAGTVVLLEGLLTFLLGFAVFGTAVDKRAPNIGGFGIGLTVFVDILACGPITGAAMNPARTLGTLIGGGPATAGLWGQHWVYWVGPVAGACLAAFVYDAMILKQPTRV